MSEKSESKEFADLYARIPAITSTRETAWICWQAASAGKAQLLEALKKLVSAEDKFCADTGLQTDDCVTEAVEVARAAIRAAEGKD